MFFFLSGVSEDGKTIMIVKKKAIKGPIKENAAKLGCKLKDGEIVFDRKTTCEVQVSLHACEAENAVVCFVNSNNIDDYLVKKTPIDPTFFEEKVEEIIKDFFENILIRKVVENEVHVKN